MPSKPAATTKAGKKLATEDAVLVASVVPLLERVFNWSADALLGDGDLPLPVSAAAAARFKLPVHAEARRTLVFAAYARYLASLVVAATPRLAANTVPTDAQRLRQAIIGNQGDLTLRSALSYAWNLGIPVLPLGDSGAFHGATWRFAGRSVIVLKQKTAFEARWLHDLFHELWHAGQDPQSEEFEIVDLERMPKERREAPEEQAATMFAGDVMLNGRAEELAEACVTEASGHLQFLKAAVPRVAARTGVSVDALANYMAFRLSLQGENWWGAAANLQTSGSPWSVARDFLVDRLDLGQLGEPDRSLLLRALEPSRA